MNHFFLLGFLIVFFAQPLQAQGLKKEVMLSAPGEIELEGNVRKETLNSPLGQINLRWPRKVESLFGRTPLKAMTEAAQVVAKSIRKSSFPTHLQTLTTTWEVVFMDENLPETQIPAALISSCHPGWMTPPANIYIVAQRISSNCLPGAQAKSSVADKTLAEVLVHELGHAVEYHLLKGTNWNDRARSEGFATWFTIYASGQSSLISQKELQESIFQAARFARENNYEPFSYFRGDFYSYALSAAYFSALEKKLGIRGVVEVYKSMSETGTSFFTAANKEVNWNEKKFDEEVAALLK